MDGRLPSRASIDPTEIARLLPYIFLVDVMGDPPRFRFRLVGTQVCTWAGRDATGLYTDEPAFGSRGPEVSGRYAAIVARRRPHYSETATGQPDRQLMSWNTIVLPLARDGVRVDMLLGAADMRLATPGELRQVWGDAVAE